MIKFFRKIRQNLLMENKTSKYFKYAIGEIVLVVFGILIALQVNNWNNNRLENNRAHHFMEKLETQIEDNLTRVEMVLDNKQKHVKITNQLFHIIGSGVKGISIDKKLDSLISVNIYDSHLNLNMNTIIEGRENGDLALITSDSLRQSIYRLNTVYETINERERIANQDLIDLFIPYLNKNYNSRNGVISFFGRNEELGVSKVYKNDNWKMLDDQEFENLMITRKMYNEGFIGGYTYLQNILLETQKLLKN